MTIHDEFEHALRRAAWAWLRTALSDPAVTNDEWERVQRLYVREWVERSNKGSTH